MLYERRPRIFHNSMRLSYLTGWRRFRCVRDDNRRKRGESTALRGEVILSVPGDQGTYPMGHHASLLAMLQPIPPVRDVAITVNPLIVPISNLVAAYGAYPPP